MMVMLMVLNEGHVCFPCFLSGGILGGLPLYLFRRWFLVSPLSFQGGHFSLMIAANAARVHQRGKEESAFVFVSCVLSSFFFISCLSKKRQINSRTLRVLNCYSSSNFVLPRAVMKSFSFFCSLKPIANLLLFRRFAANVFGRLRDYSSSAFSDGR
jgi:hypothetical protein